MKVKGFLLHTSQLECELLKTSEDFKQAHHHLEESREDARASEALKNQYKMEVIELSARCKQYEVAMVDICKKNEGVIMIMYRKYLQFDEHKSKILNSAMHFYASGYNFGLKAGRYELSKPISSLWLDECDSNGEDVQYGPDDLSIKTPASKTSIFKAFVTSS